MVNILRAHGNLLLLRIEVDVKLLESLLVAGELRLELQLCLSPHALQPILFLLFGKVLWLQRLVRIFNLIDKQCSILISYVELRVSECIFKKVRLLPVGLIINDDFRLREAEPLILLPRAWADEGLLLVLVIDLIQVLKVFCILLLLVHLFLQLMLVNDVESSLYCLTFLFL